MNKGEESPLESWAKSLEAFGRRLQSFGKGLAAANENPFAQRDQLERVAKAVEETELSALRPPTDVTAAIDAACIEATAEFWQQLSTSVKEQGWELHGTTDRRLVSRAFFVELKGDVVSVDGLPGKHSPHVPSLTQLLKPHIDKLPTRRQAIQDFVEVVCQAYEILGGPGDISIESVFRQAVLVSQPTAFWNFIDAAKFQPLPRPTFRYALSAALEHGIKPKNGREMRLMPTVNRKDVWELYSPAEGHVVQVGRIGFHKK